MEYYFSVLSLVGIYAILATSLNLVAGYAGLVSLGHAAFFGIGAYTGALLSVRLGAPFLVDLLGAVLISGLVAGILGLPSLRVRDDFFVLTTIGINFLVVALFRYVDFFGGALGILGIPPVHLFGRELLGAGFFLLVVAALTLCVLSIRFLLGRWFGFALEAMREDGDAACAIGIPVKQVKVWAFVFSGALAGLAGDLYAHYVGSLFPSHFEFTLSVAVLAMVVFGGERTLLGPILGALILGSAPEFLRVIEEYRLTFYGALLVFMVLVQPMGVAGRGSLLARAVSRAWRSLAGGAFQPAAAVGADFLAPTNLGKSPSGTLLKLRKVRRRFGGLVAVNDVSFDVGLGEILAVIGPNGAGKTTLFNMIAGALPVSEGEIWLDGVRIDGKPAYAVVGLGVARTFQLTRPFRELSTLENVLAGMGGTIYSSGLRSLQMPVRTPENLGRAEELLTLTGIDSPYWERPASALPVGLRKRLEIARALACRPRLLLLDEPAAGLTPAEVEQLAALIEELNRRGLTVVFIEHHMRFALGLAHRVVVLDHGEILAVGTPDEVRSDRSVQEVYLGA